MKKSAYLNIDNPLLFSLTLIALLIFLIVMSYLSESLLRK